MSVYREPAHRRARAAAVAALIGITVGGVAGLIVGRATTGEPTFAEQVAELGDRVRPSLSALELVQIEYSEAVRGGRVVAETEYGAAESHAESAAATLDANRDDLEAVSPRETAAAERSLAELRRLVDERADPDAVARTARAAAAAAARAAGVRDAR